MSYNQKQKLQDNIDCLKAVIRWNKGYILTKDEIDKLSAYTSFGGLKGFLHGVDTKEDWANQGASQSDLDLYEKFQEVYILIEENFYNPEEIIASIKNGVLTQFFTPSVIPATFFKVLKELEIPVDTIYEPSCGTGVFLKEALNVFPDIKKATVYEKDLLIGKILQIITDALSIEVECFISPFEESNNDENGKYSVVTSNIPFGDFKVFDKEYIKQPEITGKIHNYFFAKGLDKCKNLGILGFLVSDAFLNTKSNRAIREYLFSRADFISLVVMPDNLMSDTANTLAPSHFLVVQKNDKKGELSEEENQLLDSITVPCGNSMSNMNRYIYLNQDIIIGEVKEGTDQYGKPSWEINWPGEIENIDKVFADILKNDFTKNYKQPVQETSSKKVKEVQEDKPLEGKDLEIWNHYQIIKNYYTELLELEKQKWK